MAPTPRVPNLTGFDIKKFRNIGSSPPNDPWARMEAWRYTGPFTRRNRFRGMFPGFGIAVVAFTAYLGFEYVFLKDTHGHSNHGHEGEKH